MNVSAASGTRRRAQNDRREHGCARRTRRRTVTEPRVAFAASVRPDKSASLPLGRSVPTFFFFRAIRTSDVANASYCGRYSYASGSQPVVRADAVSTVPAEGRPPAGLFRTVSIRISTLSMSEIPLSFFNFDHSFLSFLTSCDSQALYKKLFFNSSCTIFYVYI